MVRLLHIRSHTTPRRQLVWVHLFWGERHNTRPRTNSRTVRLPRLNFDHLFDAKKVLSGRYAVRQPDCHVVPWKIALGRIRQCTHADVRRHRDLLLREPCTGCKGIRPMAGDSMHMDHGGHYRVHVPVLLAPKAGSFGGELETREGTLGENLSIQWRSVLAGSSLVLAHAGQAHAIADMHAGGRLSRELPRDSPLVPGAPLGRLSRTTSPAFRPSTT